MWGCICRRFRGLVLFLLFGCSSPANTVFDVSSPDTAIDSVADAVVEPEDTAVRIPEDTVATDLEPIDVLPEDLAVPDVTLEDGVEEILDAILLEDMDGVDLSDSGAVEELMEDSGPDQLNGEITDGDVADEQDLYEMHDEAGCNPGATCDDDDPCTADDMFDDDCLCAGTAMDCGDGIDCTADTCQDGQCLHPVEANYCLIDGTCQDAEAEQEDTPCLTCQPEVSQTAWTAADGAACDDGDVCTQTDSCSDGACVGAELQLCDDENPCTDDTCEPFFGCINIPSQNPCDDANPCTQFDACQGGQCTGQAVACNDYNECTDDSCDPDAGCSYVVRQVPSCQPIISVAQPARGVTIDGPPQVVVAGSVEATSGDIVSFTINGEAIEVDAGEFETTLDLELGLNMVTLAATDTLGAVRSTTRGLYYSPDWYTLLWEAPETGLVDDGTITVLGPEFFDDDDTSDLDDIATMLYYHLTSSFVIDDLVPSPAFSADGASLYLSNFANAPYEVDIDLVDGGLTITLTIPDLSANGTIELTYPFPVSLPMTLTAQEVVLTASTVGVLNEAGFVEAELAFIDAQVVGLEVSPALLTEQQVAELGEGMELVLVDGLSQEFNYALPNLLTNIVSAFAYDYVQEVEPFLGNAEGIEIRFISDVVAFDISPEGFAIWADTSVLSQAQTAHTSLGSMGRAQCLGEDPPMATPYDPMGTISWRKDYLNQLPHAIYRANQLHMVVAQDAFDADLTDYSLANTTFTIDFLLPPILNNCSGVDLRLQVADMRVDIAGTFMGTAIETTVWANYVLPVALETYPLATGEAALKLAYTGEPLAMHLESSGLSSDLPEEAEALLLEMVEVVVLDEFLQAFALGAFGGVYMPGLYVGKAFEGISQDDKTLYFVPDDFVEELGYSIVYGEFL